MSSDQRLTAEQIAELRRLANRTGGNISTWDEWDRALHLAAPALLAAAEREGRLREALEGLLKPQEEECWFDHHGNCQAHYLGNPCCVAIARAALALEGGH